VTMVKPNLEALRAASADVTEKYQGAVGADLLARVRQAVQ
jgi:hypothetical protein